MGAELVTVPVMLPGWYGTGSAFEQWIDGDESKLATLRRYYEEWPFLHLGDVEHGAGDG